MKHVFESTAKPVKDSLVQILSVWTDGVSLRVENDATEMRAGFPPAFKLVEGKRYRVTVEEVGGP